MFQTTYSSWPGRLQATSYPSPVSFAPTGVQPAGNWPAVTTLPLTSSNGPVTLAGFNSNKLPTCSIWPSVPIAVGVEGDPAPAKVPSPKLASTPSSVALAPGKIPVASLMKLPLLSVFQTTYWFCPGLLVGALNATSYPVAVCTAPTGVQPAANWPAVTGLP